ncbi:MAG: tyrosine-type recombinase/integrase [Bacteriovoracia bacterium]
MVSADRILTENQLIRLFKRMRLEKDKSLAIIKGSPKRNPAEVRTVVDYFLFTLISQTGLRISEALKLEKEDIHEDFLVVRAEISKNGKKGTVYFGPKTRAIIDEFLAIKKEVLGRDHWNPVFSLNGRVPSRSHMHSRFKSWLRLTELSADLSIHSLRHSYGTLCLDKGLSLTFVRDNLRHSNIAVTSQYLHLTRANRDKVKDLF